MKKLIFFLAFAFIGLIMNAQEDIYVYTLWDGNDQNNLPPATISGDITVHSGSLVIKNCTIVMPQSSEILVKRNAELYIDNVVIEATNNEWEGIRCNNETGTSSASDRVPYIKIDDSKITDADMAFQNYYTDANGTHYGGAIQATDVEFSDCKTYLDIQNFEYCQKSSEYCHFYRCQFLKTSVCGWQGRYVYLNNVKNVYFKGCEFNNGCKGTSTYGILAVNSKFFVNKYVGASQTVENDFIDWNWGIRVTNNPGDQTTPVTIADCNFYLSS